MLRWLNHNSFPGPVPLNQPKILDETKTDVNSIKKEGPLKTKKLTWQASITNETKSEPSIAGTKVNFVILVLSIL